MEIARHTRGLLRLFACDAQGGCMQDIVRCPRLIRPFFVGRCVVYRFLHSFPRKLHVLRHKERPACFSSTPIDPACPTSARINPAIKTPKFNIQAPEKFQIPSSNSTGRGDFWFLAVFGGRASWICSGGAQECSQTRSVWERRTNGSCPEGT